MVVLSYSNGRGRGPAGRGGGTLFSLTSSSARRDGGVSRGAFSSRSRGRGGSISIGGRNMTWTNPAEQRRQVPTPSTAATGTPQAVVSHNGASKGGGNRVWVTHTATRGANANLTPSASASARETGDSSRPTPARRGAALTSSLPASGSSRPYSAPMQACMGTSKAGNRVWTNASTSASSSNISGAASDGGRRTSHASGIASASAVAAAAASTTAVVAPTSPLPFSNPVQARVGTSKAGNRVWTSAASKNKPADAIGPRSLSESNRRKPPAISPVPMTGAKAVAAVTSRTSAPMQANVGVSKAGNRVWTSSASTTKGNITAKTPPAAAPPSFGSGASAPSKKGNLVWTNPGAGGATTKAARTPRLASARSTAVALPAERETGKSRTGGASSSMNMSSAKPTSAVAATASKTAAKPQLFVTDTAQSVSRYSHIAGGPKRSNSAMSNVQPTSRYSGFANHKLKGRSTVGNSGSYKAGVGQVARYSGARGAHVKPATGRSVRPMSASWGRDAWRGGTGGRGTGAGSTTYSKAISPLGVPAGPWKRGRDYVGGRGNAVYSHRRCAYPRPFSFSSSAVVLRRRYASAMPPALHFGHPPTHWAAGWASWAYGRTGWEKGGVGASRSRPPRNKLRFKNRTLIRARTLILPQTATGRTGNAALLSGPSAAARRTAVARRTSSDAIAPIITKMGMPTRYIRSGKHGMAIRRVNSTDLAARRAAVAVSTPTGKTRKTGSTTATRVRTGPGAGGNTTPAQTKIAGAKVALGATAKSTLASTPVTPRRAGLLTKIRERSAASRKAAAVVAGARARRARLVVGHNMTLYRGKAGGAPGGASILSRDGNGTNLKESNNKNKMERLKTEPCLFFCKFGKCSKSDEECRFIHDKSKVAVCRAFLNGKCTKENCPLTHAVQAEKMPVCIYFEKGQCFTPNCPYLHVKVSESAAVCPNFLKGYCPDGTACRLKHELGERKRKGGDASDGGDQGDEEADSVKKSRTKAFDTAGSDTQHNRAWWSPVGPSNHSSRFMGLVEQAAADQGLYFVPSIVQTQRGRALSSGSSGAGSASSSFSWKQPQGKSDLPRSSPTRSSARGHTTGSSVSEIYGDGDAALVEPTCRAAGPREGEGRTVDGAVGAVMEGGGGAVKNSKRRRETEATEENPGRDEMHTLVGSYSADDDEDLKPKLLWKRQRL